MPSVASRIIEPAADLAIILSMQSSHRNRPCPKNWWRLAMRLIVKCVRCQRARTTQEAMKLGFEKALAQVPRTLPRHLEEFEPLQIIGIDTVREAV